MNPFRAMPFPGSGAHDWRVESGALVAEVPAEPAPQAPAASAPLRMPRNPTKSAAAPRRKARTRKE